MEWSINFLPLLSHLDSDVISHLSLVPGAPEGEGPAEDLVLGLVRHRHTHVDGHRVPAGLRDVTDDKSLISHLYQNMVKTFIIPSNITFIMKGLSRILISKWRMFKLSNIKSRGS